MMPAPTHLRRIAVPTSDVVDEEALQAAIRCTCGEDRFEVMFPGQTHDWNGEQVPCTAQIEDKFFFLVLARCSSCQQTHCIIDQDLHGWDGFICHDAEQAALPRPALESWPCKLCGSAIHHVSVEIQTEGKR